MTATGHLRRAEAHLWLLLEEALVGVGRGGADPWEVQRHFRYVAGAMASSGVTAPATARGLMQELDDALVVRRLVPAASFTGAEPAVTDDGTEASDSGAPNERAAVWFESEVERHLDLLASFDPAVRPDAGAETVRILGAPARAFEAAGVFGTGGRSMFADVIVSIAAAGFDPGRATPGDGRVRREWVRFLRDRPAPFADPFEPAGSVRPRTVLGTIGDRQVRVEEVAWNGDALELTASFRAVEGGPVGWGGVPTECHARVLDHRGRLHLGQPARTVKDGGTSAAFRLRPGLEEGVTVLHVRVTSRGHKVDAQVQL